MCFKKYNYLNDIVNYKSLMCTNKSICSIRLIMVLTSQIPEKLLNKTKKNQIVLVFTAEK